MAPCFAHGERLGRVYKSQQFTVSLILCAQKRIRFKVQKKGGLGFDQETKNLLNIFAESLKETSESFSNTF